MADDTGYFEGLTELSTGEIIDSTGASVPAPSGVRWGETSTGEFGIVYDLRVAGTVDVGYDSDGDGEYEEITSVSSAGDLAETSPTFDVGAVFLDSETERTALASFWLDRLNQADWFPVAWAVTPYSSTTARDSCVGGVDLARKVTVELTPPYGSQRTTTAILGAIRHDISLSGWVTTFGAEIAGTAVDNLNAANWLILDDGTKGQLDQEVLGY